ncbi:MAG TPA: nicotinamide-nucleotide adenylyltransferase [Methanocorpusculum sp.]|nr:nicotinamide-nucleotide adenylyltransferase [Methanocorpusculum sp.]
MKRGLYVGRFQPFHKGHMLVIQSILETHEIDELIIGIGSADVSHDLRHPFTAGERILMITRSLDGLGIPFYVIPLEDVRRNALWVAHVKSMVPPFDIVYSSNPLVVQLFREAGIPVHSSPLYLRESLSGTAVRNKMLDGDAWKDSVPPEVELVVSEVHGIERMRQIAKSD